MKKKTKLIFTRAFYIALLIVLQIGGMIFLNYYISSAYTWIRYAFNVLAILLFFYIVSSDSPASITLPWIVLIGISPIIGITIYIIFGRKMTKRLVAKKYQRTTKEVYKIENNYGNKHQEFKLFEDYTGSTAKENSKVTYLKDGETLFLKMQEEFKKAEKYIFIEYFIVEDGVFWKTIFDILKERMSKGVKIYMIVDSFGCSTKLSRKDFKEITSSGIILREFNKFNPIVDVVQNNRDHRKLSIVDGRVGFMGGTNIADEYINEVRPFKWWVDNNVMIEGEAVINLIELFINQYNAMTLDKYDLSINDFIGEPNTIKSNELVLPFGVGPYPVYQERAAEAIYLDLIERANKTVYISSPYFVVDTYFVDALVNASKRGVDVRMIFPGVADKYLVNIICRDSYQRLIDGGIKVYEYKKGFIHSKSIYADDEAIVGTINFDYRSLIHNFECGTLIKNSPSIDEMYKDYLEIIKNDSELQTTKSHKLNLFEKIIRNILKVFYPLF